MAAPLPLAKLYLPLVGDETGGGTMSRATGGARRSNVIGWRRSRGRWLCGAVAAAGSIAALAVVASPAAAQSTVTLYVSTSGSATTGCTVPGSGACVTIQEGVTAAETYANTTATVDVAAGTYTENDTVSVPATPVCGVSR
jgi:hypothetical protein